MESMKVKIKQPWFCNRPLSPLYPSPACSWEYFHSWSWDYYRNMNDSHPSSDPVMEKKKATMTESNELLSNESMNFKERTEFLTNFEEKRAIDEYGQLEYVQQITKETISTVETSGNEIAHSLDFKNVLENSDLEESHDSDADPEFSPGMIGLNDSELRLRKLEKYLSSSSGSDNITYNECRTKERNNNTLLSSEVTNMIGIQQGDGLQSVLYTKSKTKRKPDFCFFCESEILNFARHITRNHSMELDVQKIMCKPKKSEERRKLLAALKKKGNYMKNIHSTENCFKPRKLSKLGDKSLPCIHCLGFYSSKQLRHHRRMCPENPHKFKSSTRDSEASLSSYMRVDELLKKKVFNRMQADRVSLVAQSDNLICAFGAQYLKLHREKYNINLISRKMRKVAKILIEIKKKIPSIRNLLHALNPMYFDFFIDATKIIAKFNPKTETYESPTFAMNISKSLKQCCEIGITFALKKYNQFDDEDIEKNLKSMIFLFQNNWRFDVSSQAGKDLNTKTWNKVTIIPLASDLKLLKNHLNEKSIKAASDLTGNNSSKLSYATISETIYCRLILLNRKRPGELQRIRLHTYTENINSKKESYEEFAEAVSQTEKILLRKFKRLVIQGKRGKGVPVLVSEDVYNHIDLMIQHRQKFVHSNNPYLFATPNNRIDSTIYGYKVLQKYAKQCGAKNPNALTSTRLRKHLATLTQILNMKEEELEQLAKFMGHTLNVHKNSYRLPDDIYQTAKISKLLMLMEGGNIIDFKGKSLDDIELNLEENLLTHNDEDCSKLNDYESDEEPTGTSTNESCAKNVNNPGKHVSNTNKKTRLCVKWAEGELKAFFSGI